MKLNLIKSPAVLLLASAVIFSSCVDNDKNLFDAEKVKELYENTFPVKDIDPNMDWKTTKTANVSVSVNEDLGTDYKIQIFDTNPLDPARKAKLLAEGFANQDMNFNTAIDYARALDMVFVARVDAKGRYLVKPVSIKNGTISASFGKTKTDATSRAMTKAGSSSLIPTYDAPYNDNEIIQLINEATELSDKTSGNAISLGEGGTFKVTKDTECGTFNCGWNKCTLIITQGAEFKIENEFSGSGRFSIIIADGKLDIKPNNVTISNTGNLTILPKGKLIGKNISFSDNSNGFLNYNAGKIELDGLTLSGSSEGIFYNSGEMNIKHDLTSNAKLTFINRGKLDIDGNLLFGSIARLLSACFTDIEFKLESKDLIIGRNSKVECGEFTTGGADNLTITMEPASMLECEGQATLNRIITGPNATDDYALIKIKNIKEYQDYGNSHSKVSGNIYFALTQHGSVGASWDNNGYSGFMHMLERSDMSSYLCNDKKAPFIMDKDECTGDGYVPDEEGDEIIIDPINYSYAFEDNYPLAGDYDFNDIVLDVSTQYIKEKKRNAIKEIQYNVALKAIGAKKILGAGLRLVNIPKDAIEQISFAGSTAIRETLVNSMFETGTTENNSNEVVIPLFGDAHQVYGFGGSERPLLNTGQLTNKIDTLKIIIIPSDKKQTTPILTKENLDFFIAYLMGNQGKRTEIHLCEFRHYGATANGNVHEENLEAAGNRTWGICIPNFKFPTESTKITEAYPTFEAWAQDHTSNLDWYNHPTDKTDKKYIFE